MADTSPDDSNSTSSASYNSYPTGFLKNRILTVIEESEIELTPLQVAQKLHANHSSVRVYLPQLVAEGKIVTPYKGAYCSQITHGVRFQGVRVHNIVVVGLADVDSHFEVVESVGSVKVRVVFGVERGKVSIFISCDLGMDRDSCLLALDKAFGVVRNRLGRDLDMIELKTFELNRDYLGVRVDRATCVTRVGLYGVVERVYQREQGVRHEWKISQNMPLADFEALLQGGVSGYNVMQANFMMVQEMKKLGDALKMTNSQLLEQGRVLASILSWIYKNNDVVNGGKNGSKNGETKDS